MLKKILFLSFFINFCCYSQESLKEQALIKFKDEQYNEAIQLLEQALKDNPNDFEIFYYLSWFNHYNAYDSRPLKGYNYENSEKIFAYFDKALELNPNYGDAKYFYGAECSGNAFKAMQNYDLEKLKYFDKKAFDRGAYPEWLLEYGRNFLNSAESNAILFAAGNADFNVCSYLQLHENFRTDITLIPIGNIDRPWYVKFLKDGLEGGVKKINISLTDAQIMDIHPFKWKPTKIAIKVSEKDQKKYNLGSKTTFDWEIIPDLVSDRMHAKSENELASKRSYLSPQRAILLQIIEDNYMERPIFFSNFASPTFYGGLDKNFENYGLISKLTPIETKNTVFEFNFEKMNELLQGKNVIQFKTIINLDIPRISPVIKYGYSAILNNILQQSECKKCKSKLTKLYTNELKVGFNEQQNQYFQSNLK